MSQPYAWPWAPPTRQERGAAASWNRKSQPREELQEEAKAPPLPAPRDVFMSQGPHCCREEGKTSHALLCLERLVERAQEWGGPPWGQGTDGSLPQDGCAVRRQSAQP